MYRRQPRPFISQDEFILMEIMRSKKEREQPNDESFLPPVEPIHPPYVQPIHHHHQRTDYISPAPPTQQFNRSSDRRKVNKQTNVATSNNNNNRKQIAVENKSNENLQTSNLPSNHSTEDTPVFNFFSDTVEKPIEEPVFNFLSEPTNESLELSSSESRANIEASKNLKAFLTPSTSASTTTATATASATATPPPVVSVAASNNLKSLLLATSKPGKPEAISSDKPLNTASVASLKSLLLSGASAPVTPSKTSYASIAKKPTPAAAAPAVEKLPPSSVQKKGGQAAPKSAVKSAPAPEPKANPSASSLPRSASTGPRPGVEKFASSKMLSSPDPVNLPLPDFEESFFS